MTNDLPALTVTKSIVLVVDEDPHITDSLKVLLGRDVNLLTANDRRTAFRILSEQIRD